LWSSPLIIGDKALEHKKRHKQQKRVIIKLPTIKSKSKERVKATKKKNSFKHAKLVLPQRLDRLKTKQKKIEKEKEKENLNFLFKKKTKNKISKTHLHD
jgi:hypothetical protein